MFEHLMTQRMREVWNLRYLEKVRELEAFRYPGGRDGATRPDLPATPEVREHETVKHQQRSTLDRNNRHPTSRPNMALCHENFDKVA